MLRNGSLRALLRATALAVGTICLSGLAATQAHAQASNTAREVVNSVIQDIIEQVRDRIRSEIRPVGPALRFSGEDAANAPIYDDAFKSLALGYASMPLKAPPPPPAPIYLYGFTTTGSYDHSHATTAGLSTDTNVFTTTAGPDVTKIGIFDRSDALTVIVTGSDSWSQIVGGASSTTPGIAGTISYLNGGFSTDFTTNGQWTRTMGMTTQATSYTDNVQYRWDLANAWWVEPTVGVTYTETFVPAASVSTTTEVHGGLRFGTETMWNGVKVQPYFQGQVYTIASETGVVAVGALPGATGVNMQGQVGARGSAKLTFLWTNNFSSFIDVHASGIDHTTDIGTTGGLRWTWN
jgi:hypothetical protein